MKRLSRKHGEILASRTLAITAEAKRLKESGEDVFTFASGEPDFDAPQAVQQAAIERIREGGIGYTAAAGIPKLREAVSRKFARDNQLEYELDDIVVSSGAKQCLYNALQVLCEPGDEVLIPRPYWVSYPEMVKAAGATPVFIDLHKGAAGIEADALSAAITERTKALILNTPNNPSGRVFTKAELEAIGKVVEEHDLYVLSDEIYEHLIYEGRHISFASLSKALKARTITINGVSKAYAMTGWRIGYAGAPQPIASRMAALQSHSTSNPNTIAQHAALAALESGSDAVENMRQAFDERRKVMLDVLGDVEALEWQVPKGAFYLFVDIGAFRSHPRFAKADEYSTAFAADLLQRERIAAIPGVAFGCDDYLRLSYATSLERVQVGMDRFTHYIEKLEKK